jgi:heme o synthase
MNTTTQSLALQQSRVALLLKDYAELTKLNVTTLIVMTAWCGYFFGAREAGRTSLSWGLLHALLGIAAVSSGTAALNEVMERNVENPRAAIRTPVGRSGKRCSSV